MTCSLTFAVIGGDRRSFYAAKRLREYGFETNLFGLENEKTYDPSEKIRADAVLFPVPFSKDGRHLFAPESKEKILICQGMRMRETFCKKVSRALPKTLKKGKEQCEHSEQTKRKPQDGANKVLQILIYRGA